MSDPDSEALITQHLPEDRRRDAERRASHLALHLSEEPRNDDERQLARILWQVEIDRLKLAQSSYAAVSGTVLSAGIEEAPPTLLEDLQKASLHFVHASMEWLIIVDAVRKAKVKL